MIAANLSARVFPYRLAFNFDATLSKIFNENIVHSSLVTDGGALDLRYSNGITPHDNTCRDQHLQLQTTHLVSVR
ncbi:hypothetical protein WT81_17315 [Burkholderia stagnalis]|nr:hypothetical protein WT80_26375 [Burkholderia stagnalis]KWK58599.1 hypothetical protein WT81_17315 [Burkholderia stagnalis]